MKNKLLLSSFRKIKSSYKRFLSLMFLALLGVGFYVGIKATAPNMVITLDNYLDSQNVHDIEIISTLGLTYEDILEIEKLGFTEEIYGTKSLDHVIKINDYDKNIRILSLNEIDKVVLKEGKLPENMYEIVVDWKFMEESNYKLGDHLIIDNSGLKNDEFKIVGVIESPLYFAHEYMGTTTVGNGELHYATYVLENVFKENIYTSLSLTVKGAKELETNSKKYNDLIERTINKIERIKNNREEARFDSLFKSQIDAMTSFGMEVNLDDFPKSKWYIFDRNDNLSYETFMTMTESVKQIGDVFPILFYTVAILISLISMARMVDEDRLEIGTLKGLGFSNSQIIFKYVLYAFSATFVGGIIGMTIGFNFLPRVLWQIYDSIFIISNFKCSFHIEYLTIGLLIAIICICGAAIINAKRSLKEKPSELMRPKAPKVGKKIWLEKTPFIWNKLNFSNKITTRNIFRYKGRILVTIIGIASSTALIVTGLGLKDVTVNISKLNYNNVHVYDEMIAVNSDSNIDSLLELLDENKSIIHKVRANYEVIEIYNKEEESVEINLVSPENSEELEKVIRLNDINNDYERITLTDDKIVISEKLSKLLNVKVGEQVYLKVNEKYVGIEVSNIVENYIGNYAYLSKEKYNEIYKKYDGNTLFLKMTKELKDEDAKKILEHESVSSLISKTTMLNQAENVLESLKSVVAILVIASAILAFTILYNLSTINISERRREISTLKVLGFYDEEVDSYITKENYFITVIGIIIGCVAGTYLQRYVSATAEPYDLMFAKAINFSTYIIAIILSFVFTIIVNKITHYTLKKIDMIESLKSNE